MVLFETAESKSRKAARAAEEARRAADAHRRLDERMRGLLKNNRAAAAPVIAEDKRRWPRNSGFNAATACFGAEWNASCRVQDRGFGGMRVEFSDDRNWPDEFALMIPTLRFFGIVRSVWKNGRTRGVEVVRWRETI